MDELDVKNDMAESAVTEAGGIPPLMPAQPLAGLPLLDEAQRNAEHVKILSICYYVHAGLVALFACFPVIHLIMGSVMMSGGFPATSSSASEREMLQLMGAFTVGISSLFILFGWLIAVLNFLVARKIGNKESRTFCFIVAGINCLNMPLGTVLGVFTIIVLSKQPAK